MDKFITKEAIEELQKALTPIATKLGQGGEWVYKVYYKQQIVYGIQNLLGVLFGIFLLIFSYMFIRFVMKKYKKDPHTDWVSVGVFVGVMCPTIAIFLISTCLPEALGKLTNPDYYIIQDLLSIVK